MKFTKMHGLGNDFVIFDFIEQGEPKGIIWEEAVPWICRRGFGVGADGVVLITGTNNSPYAMTIYNPDGSKAEMCGNAIRCVARYLYEAKGIKKEQLSIETGAGIKNLSIIKSGETVNEVEVNMGSPILDSKEIPVSGEKRKVIGENVVTFAGEYEITAVSMGNPHVIIFDSSLDDEKINELGPYLEKHEIFPNNTNVEFVRVVNREEITVKVWERGAGRTFACGTGACASLVASALNGLTGNIVKVNLPGGPLHIQWDREKNEIYMSGSAEFVYTGNLKSEFKI